MSFNMKEVVHGVEMSFSLHAIVATSGLIVNRQIPAMRVITLAKLRSPLPIIKKNALLTHPPLWCKALCCGLACRKVVTTRGKSKIACRRLKATLSHVYDDGMLQANSLRRDQECKILMFLSGVPRLVRLRESART